MISPQTTRIAFIGIDDMGDAIVRRLLDAGYAVTVNSREPDAALDVLSYGATWAATAGEAASEAQVVFTMVEGPHDVEDLYMGDKGIIDSAPAGAYLIDMTSSSPQLAQELFAIAAVNDLHVLDAPVSGDVEKACEGELSMVVGGEQPDFDAVFALLDLFAERVVRVGSAGSGQLTKLCNTIALAGAITGAMEAMAFARNAGLDQQAVLDVLNDNEASSWALAILAPRAVSDDFAAGDGSMPVSRLVSELGVALSMADAMELTLPGLETAYQLYDLLTIVGGEQMGAQSLSLIYEEEPKCAQFGLDWSRAEQEGVFDDPDDCGDDCCGDCGHDGHHHHDHGQGHNHGHMNHNYPHHHGPAEGGILGSFFSDN